MIPAELSFDPDAFAQYIQEHQIDALKIVPSHLQALLHAADPARVLPAHRLVLGGEATTWPLLEQINALNPACRVLNHYGPTEATVGVLTQEADIALRAAETVPLGQPLANSAAYVLDIDLNLVPLGVAGELCLGGLQVARGYQVRAAQTAECFIASPFKAGERLYRTGDRVKLLKDGTVAFLGRMDDQVKVRGYRVEPAEVARVLREQPGVAQSEVVAREDKEGRLQLHGYVVFADEHQTGIEVLREAMVKVLPDYMVPNTIMPLEALPLTANGKVDRRVLPEPAETETQCYEVPQGEVETKLAEVWSEVLGVERVGRYDNFFELGGDSILALKLVARARKCGVQLMPKHLFTGKTLADVVALIDSQTSNELQDTTIPKLPEGSRTSPLVASYAQIRQWFLWQFDPDSTAYHISGALRLKGELYIDALKASFKALVSRHESLHTVFCGGEDGQVEQVILDKNHLSFEETDLSTMSEAERTEQTEIVAAQLHQRPFDLEHGPLLRVGVIRQAGDEHILVVVMHHIISDGWSMQIIVDEFVASIAHGYREKSLNWLRYPFNTPTMRYGSVSGWRRGKRTASLFTGKRNWVPSTRCCNYQPITQGARMRAIPQRIMA